MVEKRRTKEQFILGSIEIHGEKYNYDSIDYINTNTKIIIKCNLQQDVWNDKYDWLKELQQSINKIMQEQVVQNIYICKNNEYINYL